MKRLIFLTMALMTCPLSLPARAQHIYVDDSASGNNNGSSWTDAYNYLQDALMMAFDGDEIRVAGGIYKPNEGIVGDVADERALTFQLKNGVTIKGGYAGCNAPDPDARDIRSYETILSGDLNGNDARGLPEELLNNPSRQDNSFHVVRALYTYPSTSILLNGFTITGGNANGDHYTKASGGGIECMSDVLKVQNCIVEFNSALDNGGGCAWVPALSNCIIRNNYSRQGGALIGAGSLRSCWIENNAAQTGGGIAHPSFVEDESYIDCVIQGNRAHLGGGLYITNQVASCTGCLFVDNRASEDGGAIYINNDCTCRSELSLNRCKLIRNKATGHGGALYQEGNPRVWLLSSLVSGNTALADGGGFFCDLYQGMVGAGWCGVTNSTIVYNTAVENGGGVRCIVSAPEYFSMVNSILWGNKDQTGFGTWDAQFTLSLAGTGTGAPLPVAVVCPPITYSCIQGWQDTYGGEGNIGENPLFEDAHGPDESEGTGEGDYHLKADSPCIDAGTNSGLGLPYDAPSALTDTGSGSEWLDLDGQPRIVGGTADMGAYEYQYPIGTIIYVDDDATGADNGSSWANAFKTLQDALAAVSSGNEIRVAQGIYKPNDGVVGDTPDDRLITFQLENGVTIKGGYAGFGQPDPDNRNIEVYKTILSGDIRGNDVDVSDPCFLPSEPSRMDNNYHVVTGSGTNETAVLDGFTITGGHARESGGGGMCNINGSPTVKGCTFLKNSAYAFESGAQGGGIYNEYGSPTLVECKFIMNAVDVAIPDHGSGNGGAIADTHSSPKIINCTFIRNVAMGNDGGAVYHSGGSAELTNCTFEGNAARRYGGGMCNRSGDSRVTDCTFVRNSSAGGGGLYNSFNSSSITGCKFTENVGSGFGGGVLSDSGGTFSGCTFSSNFSGVRGGGMYISAGSPTVTGCKFVRNISGDGGGGVYIESDGSPLINDCVFSENSIYDGSGGGLQNLGSLTLISCRFTNNSAPWCIGGGMSNEGDSTLTNCIFAENSSGYGAGIHSTSGTATLINCLLNKNLATNWGGGLCSVGSTVLLVNCTFAANSSPVGSGLACRSPINVPDSNVTITNCILWDQNGEIWIDDDSTVAITYSDIQGGWYTGEGNVDTDPLFMNQASGDYHLRPNSPCINAGNNSAVPSGVTTDLDSKPRIINGTVDMGAYEYEQQRPRIIYVDAGASGENNGSSWADAFKCLQDALAAAGDGTEIRVAQGAYRPDRGAGITPGDRQAAFQLLNGVAIKGGYAGFGTPHPDARDIEVYETILSGDFADNDIDVNDPEELAWEPTRSENSYRVVTGSQTDATAIIDGFSITGGYANYDDFSQCNGAGMFNVHGSPTVLNCTFIANFAGNGDGGGLGGAMYNYHGSPKLTNCRFIYNASIALDGGEGAGGAMGNWSSNPTLTNCIFTGNIAGRDGGAMWNYESNPVLVNCIFSGNLAREGGSGSFGGGMWNYNGSASLINCTFAGNTARSSQIGSGGGGIWAAQGNVKLINCTFNGNVAGRGGAISGDYPYESTFLLSNCILWNDTPDEIYTPTTLPVVTYSDVQRGWPGQGNINADPCFLAPGHWHNDLWIDGDYHLRSAGWRWDPARAEWTFDRVTSRCIDAGNPGSPLADEPLSIPPDPNNEYGCNLRIDMGAYGGTAEASIPPYDWAVLGDLNNDGAVDWLDFVCTGCDWLKTAPHQPCDLNRNGDVNPADLDLFADDWLKTTIWRK